MNFDELVFGLLDTSCGIGDSRLAARCRDLTISWCRYDYHGPIVEGNSVKEILDAALSRGYRYCFVQSYGNIICERWTLKNWESRDFCSALAAWAEGHDFLVAGRIVGDPERWYGLDHRCLLVNLSAYACGGAPSFEAEGNGPVRLARPVPTLKDGRITALCATSETESLTPQLPGWRFVDGSLQAGLPVLDLGEEVWNHMLWLDAECLSRRIALSRYLDRGIEHYREDDGHEGLSDDQREFLDIVARQASNARRGVFLFNIESYGDIESPPEGFQPPLSSLYSVAAGFKPNRILHTHGFDESTRVVFFDYSPNALQVKKCMVEQWDGQDFPHFVRYLFQEFPYPQTFYHLWGDIAPAEVDWNEFENVWAQELTQWGDASVLAEHWRAYRRLPHEYVCCDIVEDPSPLLARVAPERSAVLWWSNAFFTMYGNWFYALDDREAHYHRWISSLAALNPELFLYGSDYNNTNVNFVQAGDYWDQYRQLGVSCLEPCKLSQREIRM